jgi:hypothetical protein
VVEAALSAAKSRRPLSIFNFSTRVSACIDRHAPRQESLLAANCLGASGD